MYTTAPTPEAGLAIFWQRLIQFVCSLQADLLRGAAMPGEYGAPSINPTAIPAMPLGQRQMCAVMCCAVHVCTLQPLHTVVAFIPAGSMWSQSHRMPVSG